MSSIIDRGAEKTLNVDPNIGLDVGLGLRVPHYKEIIESRPQVSWFEAISENFMGIDDSLGGKPLQTLEQIRANYPIVLHGVSLSIGSTDRLNTQYLERLKALNERIQPEWVSDHLCWTGSQGENTHDLLPLPYTFEALDHVTERIDQVQSFLKRQLVIENVSAYLSFKHSEMTEWQFLTEITKKTGCDLLLDINNVFVSSINQGFDAMTFLNGVPAKHVRQLHLAGHSSAGDILIDTHDGPVCEAVWDLYAKALQLWGHRPTLIEWDANIPEFSVLMNEATLAQSILRRQLHTIRPTTMANPA